MEQTVALPYTHCHVREGSEKLLYRTGSSAWCSLTEGWGEVGGGKLGCGGIGREGGGEWEVQEGGNIRELIAGSCCCKPT